MSVSPPLSSRVVVLLLAGATSGACLAPSEEGFVFATTRARVLGTELAVTCASNYVGIGTTVTCVKNPSTNALSWTAASGCAPISCAVPGFTGVAGACTCANLFTGTVTYIDGKPKGCTRQGLDAVQSAFDTSDNTGLSNAFAAVEAALPRGADASAGNFPFLCSLYTLSFYLARCV